MRLPSLCTLLALTLAVPAQAEPLDVSSDEDWSGARERKRRRYYGRAEREFEAAVLDREAEQASFDREQVEFGRDRRQLTRTLRARRDALEAKQEEEARRTALVSDGTTDAELKRLEGRVREALDAPGTPDGAPDEEQPQAQPEQAPTLEDQRQAAKAVEARAREEAEQRALEEAAERTLKAAESREQRARQEAARKLGGKLDSAGQFVDPDLAHP